MILSVHVERHESQCTLAVGRARLNSQLKRHYAVAVLQTLQQRQTVTQEPRSAGWAHLQFPKPVGLQFPLA